MPLDSKNIQYCVNHPNQKMEKNEARSAITKLEKDGDKYIFKPDSGIPVRAYVCPQCGYVELYMEK